MRAWTSLEFGNRELPLWVSTLLGIVFIIGGVIVLGDVVLATVVSAAIIGVVAIVGGAFEIVHAFWTKGWGGFIWQIILGLLYIALGVILVSQPLLGALVLTWVLGIVLLASGIVRIFASFGTWSDGGWLLALSGVFGIAAGLIILLGWPASGLWLIGLLLGIDLIFHGVGWLFVAWRPATRAAA